MKTTILQSGLFLSDVCLMSSFAYIATLSPLERRCHLHMLYIYKATFICPKGILGLGGKPLKQTKRRTFHLFNDKSHNFKYISYACAEGIPQSFENERHLYP